VCNGLEGALHSGLLVKALLKKVVSLGVQYFAGCQLDNWHADDDGVELQTTKAEMKTSKLIICTNALATHLLRGNDVKPARGQILMTSPVPGLQLKGTFHFDEGFYYFRHVGNRILIGGARNKSLHEEYTDELMTTPNIQHELESFLHKYLPVPGGHRITERWSGIMGFTDTKEPVISELHNHVQALNACN
jgi:glycine/D-amino acid oxidase-like deaminating enzyme